MISKLNERAARVRFEIIIMISDQNCTRRSSITTLYIHFIDAVLNWFEIKLINFFFFWGGGGNETVLETKVAKFAT